MQLARDPALGIAEAPGLRVVVLHHMTPTQSADALLERYRFGGVPAVTRRADDSTVMLFDETARVLVLARDFAGITPLYYAANGADFAFGTRIADVVHALPLDVAPNLTSLASLLVYHHGPAAGQTFFEGVCAVPPGHTLVKRGDEITLLPPEIRGTTPQPWTFVDAADEFRRLLTRAVMRRTQATSRTAVFVSGGLDSSALICLAASAGDVVGIHYGVQRDAAADEYRYIEALRAHGLTIEEVPFLPMIDVATAQRSVLEGEAPVLDLVPATLARAAARSVAADAGTVLVGTWGDQVLSPFPPAHHRAWTPWTVHRLARAYQRYMTDVPLRDIARALRRHAMRMHAPEFVLQRRRERMRRACVFDVLATRIAEFGPAERIGTYEQAVARNVFSAQALTGIETTAKWATANGIDARLPFLDADLLSFLRCIPDEIAYHEHALKPLLREAMKGTVPEVIRQRRDKGDYTAIMQGESLPRSAVLDLLDGLRRPVQHDLMSPAAARKTLARIERETNIWDGSGVTAMVLGLDVWLRLFFEK